MIDERFKYINHTNVEGLDLIFKILCLICKIMIYRLPVRDSCDNVNVKRFKKELEVLEKGDV